MVESSEDTIIVHADSIVYHVQYSATQYSTVYVPATDWRSLSHADPTFHRSPIFSPAPAFKAFNT